MRHGGRTVLRARLPTDRGRQRHGQGYTRPVNITCQNRGEARAAESRGGKEGRGKEGRRGYEGITSRFLPRELTLLAKLHSRENDLKQPRSRRETFPGRRNRFKGDKPSLLLFIIFPGGELHGARSTPHALYAAAAQTFDVRRFSMARASPETGSAMKSLANSLERISRTLSRR